MTEFIKKGAMKYLKLHTNKDELLSETGSDDISRICEQYHITREGLTQIWLQGYRRGYEIAVREQVISNQ